MDRDRYRRIATACMVLAFVSVLAHQPSGEFRWIAIGMAVVAAVTASALYLYHHLNRRSPQLRPRAGVGGPEVESSTVVRTAKAAAENVAQRLSDESRVLMDDSFRRELTRSVLELGKMLQSLDTSAQSIHSAKGVKVQYALENQIHSFHTSALAYQRQDVIEQIMRRHFYESGEVAKRKAQGSHKRKVSEVQDWIGASMDRLTVDSPDWLRAGNGLRGATKAEVG